MSHYKPSPNSKYGWVVVAAAFLAHLFTYGIIYSFGILFLALEEKFEGVKAEIAIIPSLTSGCLYLIGKCVYLKSHKTAWTANHTYVHEQQITHTNPIQTIHTSMNHKPHIKTWTANHTYFYEPQTTHTNLNCKPYILLWTTNHT